MGGLFNIAIATIFAREVLEGSIIVINYRSIIHKSDEWSEERKRESLRAVTVAACIATLVAAVVVIAVAIPLGILGNELNDRIVAIVEGTSKLVATLFILQFSLKIPVWLGVYEKVPLCGLKKMIKVYCCSKQQEVAVVDKDKDEEKDNLNTLSLTEIRFNVMWNLWREVSECGVFLIPFFLESGSRAIPLSGVVGIAAAILLATLIYQANQRLTNKGWLACFMAGLTLMLSVGLLVGAVSEFQEVTHGGEEEAEETLTFVYTVKDEFWADSRFPMVLVQPFGYTDKRTAAQMATFWLYLVFGLSMHYVMYYRTKQVRAQRRQRRHDDEMSRDTDEEAQEISSDEDSPPTTPNESIVGEAPVSEDGNASVPPKTVAEAKQQQHSQQNP